MLNSTITENQQVDNVAHELFHGYQRENGRLEGIGGVNREVEAYLFGRGVALTSNFPAGFQGFGNSSSEGQQYDKAMNSLLLEGFTKTMFNQAVSNFISGSSVNNNGTGVYKNHTIKQDYKPLINKFLPF